MSLVDRDYFTGRMFRRQFAPALISALGLAVGDMADAVVVGQRMGVVGLAAISLSLPVFMVINVIMHGLGLGGSIRYSTQLAGGSWKEANRGFQGVFWTAVLLGTALAAAGVLLLSPLITLLGADPGEPLLWETCREYIGIVLAGIPLFFASYLLNYFLRNDDQEKLAGFGFTVGNLCDIALNIILVLCFDFGAAGAAWATLAGQAISLCIYLGGMDRRENHLRLLPLSPSFSGVWGCFRVGFASSAQYLFTMLFLFLSNHALLRTAGSVGVAVFDMVQNASFLILYLYEAAAKAAQPLLSTFQGEHNLSGQGQTLRLALGWGTAAGGAAICVVLLWPGLICALFGLDGGPSAALGCYALRVYCLAAAFAGVNVILESGCQARGQERGAFLLSLLRGTVFPLPLILLLPLLGVHAFWWLYPVSELGALLVFLGTRRRWERPDRELEQERVYHRLIGTGGDEIAAVLAGVEAFCERWEADSRQVYFVTMTVEELCTAIVNKGFQGEDGFLQVTLVAHPGGDFSLHIRDSAVSFDPFSLHTERADSAFGVDMDAMGVLVIRQKAKEFFYRRYQGFNTLAVRI